MLSTIKEQRRKRRNLAEKLGEPKLSEATPGEAAEFATLKEMRAATAARGRRDLCSSRALLRGAHTLQGEPGFASLALVAGGAGRRSMMVIRRATVALCSSCDSSPPISRVCRRAS